MTHIHDSIRHRRALKSISELQLEQNLGDALKEIERLKAYGIEVASVLAAENASLRADRAVLIEHVKQSNAKTEQQNIVLQKIVDGQSEPARRQKAPISQYQTELLARARARIAKSQVRYGEKIAYPADMNLMLDLVAQIESLTSAMEADASLSAAHGPLEPIQTSGGEK